jgi:ATP-binding cassette, subfamily F, member 3
MLRVQELTKYYADAPILREVSFTLGPGERTGIVGPNGCGKTTLLRIIAGRESADSGTVWLEPHTALGYMRQGLLHEGVATLGDVLGAGVVLTAQAALDQAGAALTADPTDPTRLASYEAAATAFDQAGGYEALDRVEQVLSGLGLPSFDPDQPIDTLSGGQKTRLALAALLLEQPNLLLLDEPTNHLDVDGLAWLENFLVHYAGAVLVVSHDRAFLDTVVHTILEVDGMNHTLTTYAGGYSDYVRARESALTEQWAQYRQQERERERVEADIRRVKEQARMTDGRSQLHYQRQGLDRFAKGGALARAGKVARKAKVRERKLERGMTADDRVEKPRATWQVHLDFAPISGGAREVLRVEQLTKSFAGHQVLAGLDLLVSHGERPVITGPNGCGKSTLLKIIGGLIPASAGIVHLGSGVRVGYYSQEQETLDPSATPLKMVRAIRPLSETEARTTLHAYLFSGDMVFTPIGRLSYGERARLALAQLILSQATLLLLDEPTNHLDIPSRERFEEALTNFGGTVISVLHDRYAIGRLATRVLELRAGTLREIVM